MARPRPRPGRNLLRVPQGEFELEREPPAPNLQAWDAADEYLLADLDDKRPVSRAARVLIVNDAFGALGVALAPVAPFAWQDSYLAQQALRANLLRNAYPADSVETNAGIEFPRAAVDVILLKVPKSLALLEHQLHALRPLMQRDTYLVAGGMARHIHASTLALFEAILGPTATTRARKKSRLIHVDRDHALTDGGPPAPSCYTLLADREYTLCNHASLFSRERLDRGSRLLLGHLPAGDAARAIVDLGCGNGVLGIVAAGLNPSARLLFRDESRMAIASARANFERAFGRARAVAFEVGDCLDGVAAGADLVLANPPFHQAHSVGDGIAWRMFTDARRVLVPGGEIRVVGNHHLGYYARLKRIFGNCETLVSDGKFVVLRATRQ